MSRLLLTHSDQTQAELLGVTQPSMQHYADLHGYKLVVERGGGPCKGRRPHWHKIRALMEHLQDPR